MSFGKKLVAELSLNNSILRETVRGNSLARSGAGKQWSTPRKCCRYLSVVSAGHWDNLTPPHYQRKEANDEEMLTERIVTLASQYGRYGYRRITALLQTEGWQVNHKRVELTLAPTASAGVWCQEGVKVAAK
jgi:hypothetical protein